MPRATDGNSRKKHIIRESPRLQAAKNFPIQLQLDWNAAQKVEAPRTHPQGQPISGNVGGAQHISDSDCFGSVISIAISLDLYSLKRFVSNGVPSLNTFFENLGAILALLATIYMCFVGGWTKAHMLEWLVACAIYGELCGGKFSRINYHCIMAVCAISLLLA